EPESLPKIFDAFEQGGRTKLGGLGLGLAISKALVEAHQGTITARSSSRNKRSTFTLTFPTCEKAAAQIAPTVSPRASEHQAMRILLVEDHEDSNRSLTNLLRRRGYHVKSALNFQSALDLSAKEQFDVLISDLALPDGSGIDLMQTVQFNYPVLGIALTGFGMEEDIRTGPASTVPMEMAKARMIENNVFIVLYDSFLAARARLPALRCMGPPGFEPGTKGL